MKKPITFSHEFWRANLISRWHDFTLRPVQPGNPLRLRLCCIAHAYNHSGAHADASVASTLTYVLRVPLLISASVPLAVRSSPGRTVWRAEAGWSCLLRSPSLSGSKPSGSKLTTLPLEGFGRPWLIPPGTVEAGGMEKGKLQPPQLHIRHKSAVRLLAGLSWRVMEWWRWVVETEQLMLQEAALLAKDLCGKLLEVICWGVKAGTSHRRKQSHSSDGKGEKKEAFRLIKKRNVLLWGWKT